MIRRIAAALGRYLEDVLILSGLLVLAAATFLWSLLAGLYFVGTVLLALGVWFTIHPVKRAGGKE